jgi:hypothetical protein
MYRNIRLASNTQDMLRAAAVKISSWMIPNLVYKHHNPEKSKQNLKDICHPRFLATKRACVNFRRQTFTPEEKRGYRPIGKHC